MNIYKKYLLLLVSIFSYNSISQVIDPEILSQLSPEQIELAKSSIENNISIDESVEGLPSIDESLLIERSSTDANEIPGMKYGYDFFSSMPTSLTAIGDLPLPNDYKISLRDQFTVILSGAKDSIFNLNVKLDGTILFPELGSVSVAGLTFKEVQDRLSQLIEEAYVGVNIDVSLQNLSAKKITIVGAVKTPGTYLVNPFSTITGALAYSGGISEIGSLRDIKLIRNNKEIFSFDLYDLLIKGDRSNDLTIEAGDTILISPASQFVEIMGAVKRPAIYEVLEGESVDNLIDFALGFTQTANKSNISMSFLDLSEAEIVEKNIKNLDQDLTNALSVSVFNYVNKSSANIRVLGAIEQPGFYDLNNFRNLKDLIDSLNFVDVYPWMAVLEQFDEKKLINSTVLFSLNDPSTYRSIELLPNSRIFFANINDATFDVGRIALNQINDLALTINHKEIISLPVVGEYSVSSLVDYLGLDMSDVDDQATYVSPLEDLVINEDYKNMRFIAKKYNTLTFRFPQNDLISVSINGAIEFPGTYTLNDDSTIEDLYKLIGSFKPQAFLDGIVVTRDSIRQKQLTAINQAKKSLNDALLMSAQMSDSSDEINILNALSIDIEPENLGRLAGDFSPKSKGSKNTNLFDGDTIFIPKNPNVISVLGEVLNPVAFEYSKGLSLNSAIELAGGYKQFADKRRVYIIKANGIVEKPKRNIYIGSSGLQPGDTIVVPRKIILSNSGLNALIPITQLLSDLAFSAAALDNLSN